MKKTTFPQKFQTLFLLIIFIAGSAFGGNIKVDENGSNKLKIKENTYSALRLDNTISDLNFYNVKTNEGDFILYTIPEYGYSIMEGEPKLPVMKKLIEVPLNAKFEYEVITKNFKEIDLSSHGIENYMIPAQPPVSKSIDNPEDLPFIFNQQLYQVDAFYNQELVKVVDLGIMRGVRIARVEIAPVQYNPVQNKLIVYDEVDVRINFVGADESSTVNEKRSKFSPYFEGIYSELFNYKASGSKELILDEPPTYIIVSDPMFEGALQPFIEWKTQKGFYVVEAYTSDPEVGNTTTSIKNYLMNFYNNPPTGINPQSFVLIVGDVAQVPAFNGTAGSHVSDLYYFTYNGSGDIFPECYYGRFSANNLNELQPQIDKTLEYEQYLFPDPTFLDEVVMVAGADGGHITWSNGQINYGTEYYFNAEHGLTSHTYLQPEPGGGNYSTNIRQNVSDGVSYGNYTAHCSASGWADPSFVISHVSQLTNAHKYPLLVGNCCSSVEFQTTCFGEALLRAENKGALGYIGGSNSTYWDEDYWWGVGFESITLNPTYNPNHLGAYDRTFHDHGEPLDEWYTAQGQMLSAGNLAVTQAGSSLEEYYWEIYHLMGDPSVMIYFSQPDETTANYQNLMPLASETFPVNTEPYASVAISKDGMLCGYTVADETGYAEVNMFNPITVPGEASVVITGQNIKPFIGTVTVASPQGAYVLFDDYEIDDSNGNNNGLVDFDEYILMDVSLENMGSATATNVEATITTDDSYITLNNGTNTWPNIAVGQTVMVTSAFAFTVDQIIEDQHVVNFDMEITDGTDTWTSTFNITLNAPVLIIQNYNVDDSYGNNNGRLDPGETVDIIVPNANEGGCEALNTIASIMTSSGLITINNTTFDLGTIGSGETSDAVFNVTVSSSAQIGDVVNVEYNVTSDPYSASTMLSMSIGLVIEDFESGDFESYAWEFDGDADWTLDMSNPYEGNYSAKSGNIDDDETSVLMINVDVTANDQISFYYKVSSESGYDYLKFYIDGTMKDEWAGEVAWAQAAYDVTAGNHTFKWEYYKDYSVSNGSDCAWVDYILFPPFAAEFPLGVVASANPSEICEGESSQLNAFAMGGSGNYTYQWDPATGLNNPNIANPIASPEVTTTYTVTVNDGDAIVEDEVMVTVNPVPDTPTIEQQGSVLVSSTEEGNQWFDSNGMINGATAQTFEPTYTENFYVVVTNGFGCESDPSNQIYYIYTGLIEIADGLKVNIYPNPFTDGFTLDYSLKSVSVVKISIYNSYGQLVTILEDNSSRTVGNYRVN
ncbi:MAG: hypothetical protein JW731_13515, partial [Bacteroidales bacterium]|nr:hypothetical protein [Bacteroidales bacterium]